jgi:hypothetical protein
MNAKNAQVLTFVAVAICLGALWFKAKGTPGSAGLVRTVEATMVIGGVLFMLAPVVPEIVIPLAGLLIADVLVLGKNGTGVVGGIANAVVPPAATKQVA